MKNHEMSDAVTEAIKQMPVHFTNDTERVEYIKAHADHFVTRYKTQKTNQEEQWPDIDTARKVAKFVTAFVGSKTGGKMPKGIQVIAVLGDYDAVVEIHSAPPKTNGTKLGV